MNQLLQTHFYLGHFDATNYVHQPKNPLENKFIYSITLICELRIVDCLLLTVDWEINMRKKKYEKKFGKKFEEKFEEKFENLKKKLEYLKKHI